MSDIIQQMAKSPRLDRCSTCYQYMVGLKAQKVPAVGFFDLTSKMVVEEGRRKLSPILWRACQEHLAEALNAGFACYDLDGQRLESDGTRCSYGGDCAQAEENCVQTEER